LNTAISRRNGTSCEYVENNQVVINSCGCFLFELPSFIKQFRMNAFMLRTAVLVLHAAANILLITFLFNYDITGSWVFFIGFIVILLLLLFLFIKHLLSYIYFIKTKTK
jgi:hypothetical protein